MSSWTFKADVDVSELLRQAKKWGDIPEMMMSVAEEVAMEVKKNIRDKDIIDTGALLESIVAERKSDDVVSVHDGPARDGRVYGVYQEFGWHTSRGNHVSGRPHFIPAVEKFGTITQKKFTELIK